jgi:hypothetical protein
MTNLAWLAGYGGQTTTELIALGSSHRKDSIILAFEEALQKKEYLLGRSALSIAELTILAVEALEREVNNGGYVQFFVNSNEYAGDIVDALIRINQPEIAHLSRAAIHSLELS